ncbi:phage tail tape measure protein, partial [Listeria booriae]|nr:phage tail tape measure protein [Listeria booriae]
DITERSIAALEQQLELTKQEYGENSKEAIQMSTKLNVAKTSVSELDNELDQLKDELGGKLDAGNFLEAAEVLGEVGEKLKEVGTSAVETALDIDDSVVKINNSLGLTGKEAEKTKEHLLNVFNTGVTDSYEEAGDAIIQVRQSIKDVNDENLDDITYKAMSFSSTFDTDINETVRGAG